MHLNISIKQVSPSWWTIFRRNLKRKWYEIL